MEGLNHMYGPTSRIGVVVLEGASVQGFLVKKEKETWTICHLPALKGVVIDMTKNVSKAVEAVFLAFRMHRPSHIVILAGDLPRSIELENGSKTTLSKLIPECQKRFIVRNGKHSLVPLGFVDIRFPKFVPEDLLEAFNWQAFVALENGLNGVYMEELELGHESDFRRLLIPETRV